MRNEDEANNKMGGYAREVNVCELRKKDEEVGLCNKRSCKHTYN